MSKYNGQKHPQDNTYPGDVALYRRRIADLRSQVQTLKDALAANEAAQVNPQLALVPGRIGDADRDATISRLRDAYASGHLDVEVTNTRMSAALAAVTKTELAELTSDLPAPPAPAVTLVPAGRARASRRRLRWFAVALTVISATAMSVDLLGPPWVNIPTLIITFLVTVASIAAFDPFKRS